MRYVVGQLLSHFSVDMNKIIIAKYQNEKTHKLQLHNLACCIVLIVPSLQLKLGSVLNRKKTNR